MTRLITLLTIFGFLLLPTTVFAQTTALHTEPNPPQETFTKAKVVAIIKQAEQDIDGYKTLNQTISVQFLEGPEAGKLITLTYQSNIKFAQTQKMVPNKIVIIDTMIRPGNIPQYTISDTYRLDNLFYLALAFFLITIAFAGKRGAGAIIGLGVSLTIIMGFIVPQILHHHDPLLISLIGCLAILLSTTYLAHGFSKTTSIAIFSTFLALLATCLFAVIAVTIAHLAGLGTEDSYLLEITPNQSIDPRGLLLGGILIGTLGALNDITTTQVVSIFTLFKHNPKLNFMSLAEQGFLIGREHIVSLVNTLVLAYAGTSLPIFIFFALNPSHLPVWVILNNESVAEEIIRTVAGSLGLVLAIPITTFLASWFAQKQGFNHASR